jgi:hypothetical protein
VTISKIERGAYGIDIEPHCSSIISLACSPFCLPHPHEYCCVDVDQPSGIRVGEVRIAGNCRHGSDCCSI